MPHVLHRRLLVEDFESGEIVEIVSVIECAELIGCSVGKIENLMFGSKKIAPKLNYIVMPKVEPKFHLSTHFILLDSHFEEVRDYVAKIYACPDIKVKKVNRSYARHDKDY